MSVQTDSLADPVRKTSWDLVHAYRKKYRKSNGSIRQDAPLLQEVTLLNAALHATEKQAAGGTATGSAA